MYKERMKDPILISNNQIHNYNTRNSNKVSILPKPTLFEKGLYFITVKYYDNLPALMKNIKNEILFENLLEKILIHFIKNIIIQDPSLTSILKSKIMIYLFTSRANVKLQAYS
jgi:hypothetical protein